MTDSQIRFAFHSSILREAHLCNETLVVDELGLKNGEIRADIAVINGKLLGYEIKSEKDSLNRLPSQVEAYNEIFDKAFIIVSKNHLEKAIQTIPEWWGIYEININQEDKYSFTCIRRAKINKWRNSYSIAQLLWKVEALEVANILLRHNINPKTSKHEIYDIISGTCSSKKISKIAIQYLKLRDNWRINRIQPS